VKAKATVRAGQTAELRVELLPGAVGTIDVWWPWDRARSKRCGYRITAATGKVARWPGARTSLC